MNPIAVYSGSTVLFWSSIVIFLGLAASLFLSLALHRANGGRTAAMLLAAALLLADCEAEADRAPDDEEAAQERHAARNEADDVV